MNIRSRRVALLFAGAAMLIGIVGTDTAANATEVAPTGHVITYNVIDASGAIVESTVGHRGALSTELEAQANAAAAARIGSGFQPMGVIGCGSSNSAVFFHPSVGDPICFGGEGQNFVTITQVTGFGAGNHWLNVGWSSPGASGNFNAAPFTFTDLLPANWTAHSESLTNP